MRVVLAGASGLIGTALRESLRSDGHEVISLVRRAPSGPNEVRWDPARRELDPEVFTGAEAVVCLSGVGVGDHRWNNEYKAKILASRVDSVSTIAATLAEHGGPHTFLVASAVGYYGDTGDRIVTVDDPPGDTFLADVCVQWEAAAQPARDAGVRVRTGLVLAGEGGMLDRLVPIASLGVAGKMGSGRQYMPWIALSDEIGAIRFLLDNDIAGAANLTAPNPVRNADFMSTLGRVLHRPTVLPTPAFALRIALGEFAEELLGGQRAVPQVLLDAGFEFRFTELEPALRAELDR
jgi:uncharacterized protein (TIGR01777 family)